MTEQPKENTALTVGKINSDLGKDIALQQSGRAAAVIPANLGDVIKFGQVMAKAGPMIPPAFRENPGMCIAVAQQAWMWGMDPFAVASKAYIVNDRVAYEAQLIASVVNTRANLRERPRIEYEDEGPNRKAIVTATFKNETEPRQVTTPTVATCKKKSPLWDSDPDQQLAYYGLRAWARRYCPEVLLGVYTPEEAEEIDAVQNTDGVYVAAPASKPERSDYNEDDDEIVRETVEELKVESSIELPINEPTFVPDAANELPFYMARLEDIKGDSAKVTALLNDAQNELEFADYLKLEKAAGVEPELNV